MQTFYCFQKVISLLHYGKMWQKLDKLISYCEVQVESLLQGILQFFVMETLFMGKRNTTSTQWRSAYMSMTMVVFALSKRFMPSERDQPILSKFKQILWSVSTSIGLITLVLHYCNFLLL